VAFTVNERFTLVKGLAPLFWITKFPVGLDGVPFKVAIVYVSTSVKERLTLYTTACAVTGNHSRVKSKELLSIVVF
jgi:hypothetical protein